jgi:hypothetical protein
VNISELASRCGMTPAEFRAHVAANVATARPLTATDATALRGLIPTPGGAE